jgi:hypothetical protein
MAAELFTCFATIAIRRKFVAFGKMSGCWLHWSQEFK